MCRLLGYLGPTIQLDKLLYKPEHSLVVQSYQPKEMNVTNLNADGFGIGWYNPQTEIFPYTYRNTVPIWNDVNLPEISRYVKSQCILGYVRSATPGLSVSLSNCQPFTHENWLFFHNGFIKDFRNTLYLQIRKSLDDSAYQWIKGSTDSEHIFALLLQELATNPQFSMLQALEQVINKLANWVEPLQTRLAVNVMITNGKQLIASRYAKNAYFPSLYWLRDDPAFPDAVILASEPLFTGNWNQCPENSLISVGEDLEVKIAPISQKGLVSLQSF